MASTHRKWLILVEFVAFLSDLEGEKNIFRLPLPSHKKCPESNQVKSRQPEGGRYLQRRRPGNENGDSKMPVTRRDAASTSGRGDGNLIACLN